MRSWKKEFYPITAYDFYQNPRYPVIDIIKHSLKKWQGLTPANLKKHNVVHYGNFIKAKYPSRSGFAADSLWIDSGSCSLCQGYWDASDDVACAKCPLYLARNEVPCYTRRYDEKISPYDAFTDPKTGRKASVTPMIKWLKKTLAIVEKKS